MSGTDLVRGVTAASKTEQVLALILLHSSEEGS